MKTLKIFLLSILLSFIFFPFTSCSNDELVSSQYKSQEELSLYKKNSSELTPKQIGDYHNIAIELYFEYDNGYRKTVKEIESSVISLLTANYPDLMEGFIVIDDYNFIKPYYDAYSINPIQLESVIDHGFNELTSNKQISSTFANDLKELTLSDISFEEKILFLNSYNSNSVDEGDFIDVYKEVFIASNNLWNQYGTIAQTKMKCSSGVIAADAVGAGLGLFGGPLWSIIQGAVVSIAVNEDCK